MFLFSSKYIVISIQTLFPNYERNLEDPTASFSRFLYVLIFLKIANNHEAEGMDIDDLINTYQGMDMVWG